MRDPERFFSQESVRISSNALTFALHFIDSLKQMFYIPLSDSSEGPRYILKDNDDRSVVTLWRMVLTSPLPSAGKAAQFLERERKRER